MTHFSSSDLMPKSVLPEFIVSEFMSTSRGYRCRTTLGDKAARQLLQWVYASCDGHLPSLSHSCMHLARDACGIDNWKSLPQRMSFLSCAGICLAFLVTRKALPLRMHTTRSGKGPRKYWVQYTRHGATVLPCPDPKPVLFSAKNIIVNRT